MALKLCPKCKIEKSTNQFDKRGGNRKNQIQSYCKLCRNNAAKKWRLKNPDHNKDYRNTKRLEFTIKIIDYLEEHPCVDCGESDILVLDFDHIKDKKNEVSRLAMGRCSWKNIMEEINKCEVRCANCHRRKTLKERDTLKYKLMEERKVKWD